MTDKPMPEMTARPRARVEGISSVFAHNVAKICLARSIGGTAKKLDEFLKPGSSGSQH